jgi:molybdenum cofactor guanylyltransferase
MPEALSLVLQAGGQSRRMGRDKGLLPFLGQPLIQRLVERLSPIASEVLVTTNRPQDYAFLGLRLVEDLLPGRGALGGLYTALSAARFPLVAVVACDLPFANPALLEDAARLLVESDADGIVPRSPSGLEPLHAVYRREPCLPVVKAALEAGQLKLIDWFPQVRLLEQSAGEIAALDPGGLAFFNINAPQDLLQAERLAETMN